MSVILEVWDSMVVKIIATIVGPMLLAVLYYLFRRIYRAFKALKFAESALQAVARGTADNGLPNTPEADELDILATLIEAYEDKHFPMDLPSPAAAIRFRMEQQGLRP